MMSHLADIHKLIWFKTGRVPTIEMYYGLEIELELWVLEICVRIIKRGCLQKFVYGDLILLLGGP